LFDGDFHAEEFGGSADEEGEVDGFGFAGIDIDDAADRFFASDFGVEFGESVEGGDDAIGIDGSLESVAGFGEESEFGSGFADGGVGEVGSFEKAAGGGGGDFSIFAAHDASESDGPIRVGDDHVVGLEFVSVAVEGFEFFARLGLTDDDALSAQKIEIVSVEGLSDLEHDVVGEVNKEGDGALTDLSETLLEPFGRRAVLEVFEDSAGESATGFGLDFDRGFGPNIA